MFGAFVNPSHGVLEHSKFVICQALKCKCCSPTCTQKVFLPTLVTGWSRWWILHTDFWKNLVIFLYFPPWTLQHTNHHFCLLLNQHLVKSGCKIKLPQFWIQYCNPKDIKESNWNILGFGVVFFLLNGQNCFCSKIIVCPDYNDKSPWLTLSKMSLVFSDLSFHIKSHFYVCHNFQPFFQKIRIKQIRYYFCFV